MSFLFDPDYIYKAYEKELAEIAKEEGLTQGREEGMRKFAEVLVAKDVITKEFAEQTLTEENKTTQ